MTGPMSERQLKVIILKSELFDIQNEMAQCRVKMEAKIKELNIILQQEKDAA